MKHCCEAKSSELQAMRIKHTQVLKIVLFINALMFFVEVVAGIQGKSTSLLADSLDMFGDSLVYAFSLYVVDRNTKWKNMAAVLKGSIMTFFAIGVFSEAIIKMTTEITPKVETMGIIGALALAANFLCLLLLLRHRKDDLNMRSIWLCSRNDIVANLGVILAAVGVYFYQSKWPDIFVGLFIAGIFLSSAYQVLKESFLALRAQ